MTWWEWTLIGIGVYIGLIPVASFVATVVWEALYRWEFLDDNGIGLNWRWREETITAWAFLWPCWPMAIPVAGFALLITGLFTSVKASREKATKVHARLKERKEQKHEHRQGEGDNEDRADSEEGDVTGTVTGPPVGRPLPLTNLPPGTTYRAGTGYHIPAGTFRTGGGTLHGAAGGRAGEGEGASVEDDVPDAVEPLIGYRAWVVHDELGVLAPTGIGDGIYHPGRNEARCGRCKSPPGRECGCGFYGLNDPEKVMDNVDVGNPNIILGAVLAWGRVVVGDEGFRCQYAQPVVLLNVQGNHSYSRIANTYGMEEVWQFWDLEDVGERVRKEAIKDGVPWERRDECQSL